MSTTLENLRTKAGINFKSVSLSGSRFGIRVKEEVSTLIEFLEQMGATSMIKAESFGEFVVRGNL